MVIWEREQRDDRAPWTSRVAELTGLRGARVNPGWETVRALSIAAVVAALISSLVGWRSRPHEDAPPPRPAPRSDINPNAVASGHRATSLADAWQRVPADLVQR